MGDYGENSGSVGGVDPPTPTVTAVSGSLYGSEDLLGGRAAEPDKSADSAVVENPQLVNGQGADKKLGLYLDFNSVEAPQPERGGYGSTDPGPRTYYYERINPDVYSVPGTDSGDVAQASWPLGLSHNRQGSDPGAGWARQQNVKVLPSATAMAGVDMRLGPHAYRELHWHTANEWSLILKGCVRVSSVNDESQTFVDDVCAGDVWYFPSGVPHSIQAFEEGTEFLLVFDDGSFSEDETFLLSEMMIRNPVSVLAKNFKADPSAFDKLADDELYVSFCFSPPSFQISNLIIADNPPRRSSTALLSPTQSMTLRTLPPPVALLMAHSRLRPTTGLSKLLTRFPVALSKSSTPRPSPLPRTSPLRSLLCSPVPCVRFTGTPLLPSGTTSCKVLPVSQSSRRPKLLAHSTSQPAVLDTSHRLLLTTLRTLVPRT